MRAFPFQVGARQLLDPRKALEKLEGNVTEAFKAASDIVRRPYRAVRPNESYTASPWDIIECDIRGGGFPVLLPDPSLPEVIGTPIVIKTISDIRKIDQFVHVESVRGPIETSSDGIDLYGTGDAMTVLSMGSYWAITALRVPKQWMCVYELDFREQADQTIVNGTQTIDGKIWTGVNVGNAATFAIQNGTGLVIAANSTSTDYFSGARSTPMLTIPFFTGVSTALLEAYSTQNFIIRMLIWFETTNQNANFEAIKFGVEDNSAPTNQNIQVAKISSGGVLRIESISTVAGTSSVRSSLTNDSTDDILGVIFEAPNGLETWSGLHDHGAHIEPDRPRLGEVQNIAAPLMFANTQPRLFIAHQTVNTTASFTATIKKLRIDRYTKNPVWRADMLETQQF